MTIPDQLDRRDHRLPRRDLAWRDNEVVWGIRSANVPTAQDVRAALRSLFASCGSTHFLRLLDAEAGRYRRPGAAEVEDLIGAVVASSPAELADNDLTDQVERAQQQPLGCLPFRFTVGPDWALMRFCHALGDAGTVWPLYMGLIRPDKLLDFLPVGPQQRYPLPAALWSTFGRNPRRLRTAVQASRAPLPLRAVGAGPFGASTTQVVGLRSAAGFRRELVAARKRAAPGASMVGQLVAAAMTAATAAGLRPYPGVAMVADVRRHLPVRTFGAGNFSAGAYLALPDPTDPRAVTAAIDSYVSSGRPLLTLSLMAARAGAGPRTEPIWDDAGTDGSVITFSHVGKLPFPIAPPEVGLVLGKPIGRRGLAIVTHEMGPYVYASVSFDERYVSRRTATEVARALVRPDERVTD